MSIEFYVCAIDFFVSICYSKYNGLFILLASLERIRALFFANLYEQGIKVYCDRIEHPRHLVLKPVDLS